MSGGTSRRERKVVTVVFCDLVGFTSRAESMDPEDVEALLRPVPLARARGARAPRRHGREVHRRCRDGALRRAERTRGRPRARRPSCARDSRLRCRGRARAPSRDHHWRGAHLARRQPCGGRGHGLRAMSSTRQHGSRAPHPSTVSSSTRRRFRATRQAIDYAEAPSRSRPKARLLPSPSGTRGPLIRDLASTSRTRHAPDLVGRERELAVVRDGVRSRASRACAAAPHPRRRSRHRQEPAGVRALPDCRGRSASSSTWRQGRCLAYGDGITLWALSEIVKAQAGILEAGRRPRRSPRSSPTAAERCASGL